MKKTLKLLALTLLLCIAMTGIIVLSSCGNDDSQTGSENNDSSNNGNYDNTDEENASPSDDNNSNTNNSNGTKPGTEDNNGTDHDTEDNNNSGTVEDSEDNNNDENVEDNENEEDFSNCEHTTYKYITTDATCTKSGIRNKVCSSCSEILSTEILTPKGHNEETLKGQAANCTETGYTDCIICSVCFTVIVPSEEIPSLGHKDGEWKTIQESTCEKEGIKHQICSICNETMKTEAIPLIDHNYINRICSVCGIEKTSQGLAYTLSEDKTYHCVSGIGSCSDTEIIIPLMYNDLPVKAIEENAFIGCDKITSIIVPNSITSIGSAAFKDCSSLKSITIPFVGTNATASKFDSHFGYIFGYSTNANSGQYYDGYTRTYYTYYIPSTLQEVTIGGGARSIPDQAFRNCTDLTSITIHNNITSIASGAFQGCNNLTEISLPFVGASNNATGYDAHFGYIFGYTIGTSPSDYHYEAETTRSDRYYTYKIPQTLTNVVITGQCSLKNQAFRFCEKISSITLSDNTSSIGDYVFYSCSSLLNICVPNSVTSIGYQAFTGCTNLVTVTIGEGVSSIGKYAFSGCKNITCVHVSNLANWCSISFAGYEANPIYYTQNLYLNDNLITDLDIPLNVKEIKAYAFYNCTSITKITVSENVTSIGKYAFYGLTSLENINFNAVKMSNLESSNQVFYEAGLNGNGIKVTIGKNVTAIPSFLFNPNVDNAFSPKVVSVEFEENSVCQSIGENAFGHCTNLSSISMPNSVEYIGASAFFDCQSLKEIIIPNSVTDIDADVFTDCTNLTKVSLPTTVNSFGGGIFTRCSKINNITLPQNITQLPLNTFNGCSNLTSVTIPDSVTSIGYQAFYQCSSLTTVNMGNNVTSIGMYAFYYCKSLSKINISNSLKSIGAYAFQNCRNIITITIPESVTIIGDNAFYQCTKLTEVYNLSKLNITKGSSYGYIGNYALNIYTATSGEKKTFETEDGFVFYINSDSIYLMGYLGNENSISLPDSYNGKTYAIYSNAFVDNTNLTNISLGKGITAIGNNAFNGCRNIKTVNITDLENWCAISFSSSSANPLNYGADIYIDGKIVTDLVIPNTVTKINFIAFCSFENPRTSIITITIPNSITSIDDSAFHGCRIKEVYNLSSLNITAGASSYGDIGYYALNVYTATEGEKKTFETEDGFIFYEDDEICYLFAYNGNQSDVILPENCNGKNYKIGDYAFYNKSNILSVTIPNSVTSIDNYAFSGCSSLNSVTISKNLASIGRCAFYGCSNLTGIVIPDAVTYIGQYAFFGCAKLTSAIFENTNNWWYSSSSTATEGKTIDSSILSNDISSATYLTSNYYNYYWKRS